MGCTRGVATIILEFIVGVAAPAAAYSFSFVAILAGGFVAGWFVKEKTDGALVSGALSGLIYVVIGLYVVYHAFGHAYTKSAVAALIVSIVLGAIGAIVANYLAKGQKSPKPRARK